VLIGEEADCDRVVHPVDVPFDGFDDRPHISGCRGDVDGYMKP
jgi:hypothetical protein